MRHQIGPHMKVAFGATNPATNQKCVFASNASIFRVHCALLALTRTLDGIIRKAALNAQRASTPFRPGRPPARVVPQALSQRVLGPLIVQTVLPVPTSLQHYLQSVLVYVPHRAHIYTHRITHQIITPMIHAR